METGLNTLQNVYKVDNLTLTVSSIAAMVSAIWLTAANSCLLQCVALDGTDYA